MPAVRDYSASYETVTTDAGLTVPMCAHDVGDLLLAFCGVDTGAPTWGVSTAGWTQLFSTPNGTATSACCFYKIAASAAEPDVVFTSAVNETYTGCVISIRDVDTSTPFGSPAVFASSTQVASTRFAMPTITTTRANALVIHMLHHTGSPGGVHFVENAAHELAVVDGAAEGLGIGWVFQRAAGTSAADIFACSNATGVGVKAVIQVVPPASGATVIPPHCVSDASIYLNPNGGTTAWDGCTQMAATADTRFGTSIGGKTCNDATVAAVVDVGINSFHSLMGLTNAATANQMSGAQVVLNAARYNLGSRDILAHFRHPTPANNQRLTPLSSGRGVWMGIGSGATNATNQKVWQVHGADVPIIAGNIQPVVVNAANADTIASAGTITTTDIRNVGFWTSGIGVLTQQSCIGPMWAMDTLVLAGGVAAEPVGIPEIVAVAATGKERLSSLLQGADQMLCLQAIQFGNGGTNPIFLDLDSTAIEFPGRKNVGKKRVNYNGIDNACGFTYYGGPGDTIRHKSSVVSSANKYHWRIHASASASASWDFSGLSIIGAGDVQLRPVTTFAAMSFTTCPTINQNGSAITDCNLTGSKVIASALADLGQITACAFTSSGTGHAIEVSGTAGTVSLSGNTFTGYAATNGSTGNEAIFVNIATGTVTINIAGGGSTPSIRTAGATVNVVSGATVTFTGLPTGTDIVILTAGTSTVLQQVDQNAGSSFAWGYSGTPTVDVGFLKPGYVPQYIRGLSLGASDSSIPVSLQADRNYF